MLKFIATVDVSTTGGRDHMRTLLNLMDDFFPIEMVGAEPVEPTSQLDYFKPNPPVVGSGTEADPLRVAAEPRVFTAWPASTDADPLGIRNWPISVTIYDDGRVPTWRAGPDNVPEERIWAKVEKERAREEGRTVPKAPEPEDAPADLPDYEPGDRVEAPAAPIEPATPEQYDTLAEAIEKPGKVIPALAEAMKRGREAFQEIAPEGFGEINTKLAEEPEPWPETDEPVDPPRYMLGDDESPMAEEAEPAQEFAPVEPPEPVLVEEEPAPDANAADAAGAPAPKSKAAPALTLDERIEIWRLWNDVGMAEADIAEQTGIRRGKVMSLISSVTSKVSLVPGTGARWDGKRTFDRSKHEAPKTAALDPDMPDVQGWSLRQDADLMKLRADGMNDGGISRKLKKPIMDVRARHKYLMADMGGSDAQAAKTLKLLLDKATAHGDF